MYEMLNTPILVAAYHLFGCVLLTADRCNILYRLFLKIALQVFWECLNFVEVAFNG